MNYVIKRIGRAVLTLIAVISVSFVISKLMPGGPADVLIARLSEQGYSGEQINRIVELQLRVSPDKPLLEAYVDYMISIFQLNFGESIMQHRLVVDILLESLPWTVFYASISLFVSFSIGIAIGAIMAYREGTRFDSGSTISLITINSTPFYVFAIIVLAVLGYQFGLFPTDGKVAEGTQPGFNLPFLVGVLHHATLPIATSVFMHFGGFALGMRSNSISVLGEDYIRVGQLRGLSSNRIALRYVGRNAILPLYTRLMLALGGVIGGSIILEKIFEYHGIGYYLFRAVETKDMPLMMGGFIMMSVAVITGLLIADLTYDWLDPQASGSSSSGGSRGGMISLTAVKRLRRAVEYKTKRLLADSTDDSQDDRYKRTNGSGKSESDSVFEITRTSDEITKTEYVLRVFDEYVRSPVKIVATDWRSGVGFTIVLFYIFIGTVGVALVGDTGIQEAPALLQPFETMAHPLGTDTNGNDLLSLVVNSTPAMLQMLLSGAVFATALGTLIGTVAGYSKGTAVDRLLMTVSDITVTIPGLPLVIVLAATVEPDNPYVVGILLSVTSWAGLARTLRSEVLTLTEVEYVEASQMMGIPSHTIILREIIPNLMPFILINFVGAGRRVIFSSVGLYFLGVLPFTNRNWGVMLNHAQEGYALMFVDRYYWLLIPLLAITLLSIGLVLLAQAMDRLFNPRIRARHTKQHSKEDDGSQPVQAQTAD